MNPNCIYEVKTHWGYFKLCERAYEDYLKGRLWITWTPGENHDTLNDPKPAHISDKAAVLLTRAEKLSAWEVLTSVFHGDVSILPYKSRMSELSIDEMSLSVRASNGLLRAKADTLGKVAELIARPSGLKSVRNLGAKSESEILSKFADACYALMNKTERALFWQSVLDSVVTIVEKENEV